MAEITDAAREQLDLLTADKPNQSSQKFLQWMENWESLVEEIGAYRGSIADEYFNDLGARDHLAIAMTRAHEMGYVDFLSWALPLVEEVDRRFVIKTVPDDEGLMWGNYLDPNAWWNRRLPKDEGLLERFRTIGAERRRASYTSS